MSRRSNQLTRVMITAAAALMLTLSTAAMAQQDAEEGRRVQSTEGDGQGPQVPAEAIQPAAEQGEAEDPAPDAEQPAGPRRIEVGGGEEGRPAPPEPKVIEPDPDYKPVDREAVAERFVDHVEASKQFTDAQKKLVRELAKPVDGRIDEELITSSLIELYPRFASAMEQLGDEDTGPALKTLKKLAKSDDPYLAAHARFFQARAYSMAEDFEDALPLLKKLSEVEGDERHLMYGGETLFLRGVAEAETLKRDDAIRTLKTFVKHYPDASERMLVGALYMIDQLSYMADGTIYDVQDRMDYSRRRLALIEPGEQTQKEQENIIAILDKLIEEAEQEESSGGGGGGGGGQGPQGQGQGSGGGPAGGGPGGAQSSSLPPGQDSKDLRERRMSGNDVWSPEREKEREEVINANKDKFPDRYRKLIEQYYKSLQEEN